MIALMLSLPFLVLLISSANKPIKPKKSYGKVYRVVLLDKNRNRIKEYTYIK